MRARADSNRMLVLWIALSGLCGARSVVDADRGVPASRGTDLLGVRRALGDEHRAREQVLRVFPQLDARRLHGNLPAMRTYVELHAPRRQARLPAVEAGPSRPARLARTDDWNNARRATRPADNRYARSAMSTRIPRFVSLLIALVWTQPLAAQAEDLPRGRVSGRVRTASGEPWVGAHVVVLVCSARCRAT